MTIAQMDEAQRLLSDRSCIQGKIDSLKEVYAIDFYDPFSGGKKAHYEEYAQGEFWSDLNGEVINAAREAAVVELIKARDKITAQLKELGLEE